jgi:acyl-CoA synthetase (AMP-forming)/AMP-acid ligase II
MQVLDTALWLGHRIRAGALLLPHLRELSTRGHASVATLVERNAKSLPDETALLFEDRAYTWSALNAEANRWARVLLAEGVVRGDVVSLAMDNRPEYIFCLVGASKIRAVAACVNTNLTGPALAHAFRIARTRLIVTGSEHEASVNGILPAVRQYGPPPKVLVQLDAGGKSERNPVDEQLRGMSPEDVGGPPPEAEEPMAYLYTSGTTGLPKAAIVTNQRFLLTGYAFGRVMHAAGPGDVIYAALPLYHGTAQWGGLGASIASGAALALRRKFSASNFWKDAIRFRATRVLYIGELCRYLLHQPAAPEDRAHSVRIAVGNGLRPEIWGPFQERFGIPLVREFYGATEGNAPLANLEGRRGMLGRLMRGQAIVECDLESGEPIRDANGRCRRIAKPGETGLFIGRISRTARFDGYVDPNATQSKILTGVFKKNDAWFNSGDLVTLHEGKWVSFADRVGDTFRWKGENVSTNEVAALLNGAPGVLESNVFGVQVPGSDGRAGMACLVVSKEFDPCAFGAYVTARLPKYAKPIFVRLLSDMQVTSTLKHQKTDYRREGYDPARISDRLYVWLSEGYVPLTAELYERIRSGALSPG